jgi:pimeloyl-ACP methyl ester carboxylesterase
MNAGLNYRRTGRGPTLVLQHGYLGGGGIWLPQIVHFSGMYDVIAPDLPGFAGSGHLPPVDRIEDMAGAVIELLDSLGVESFHLIGHSMGGMVVQQIAAEVGPRIDRLVLYGTACSGAMPRRFETFEESMRKLARDGLEATSERIAATWFRQGRAAPYFPMCLESGRGTTLEAALAGLTAMPAWDRSAEIADFPMPTLVIGGDHDRSYSLDEMGHLARTIPDAQLALLPGCAHNAHLEKPDLFNRIVGDFLLSRADS